MDRQKKWHIEVGAPPKKLKNAVPWTYVISNLNCQKLLERFTKTIEKNKSRRVQSWKVIKRNGGKWKGYDKSFISWIDK